MQLRLNDVSVSARSLFRFVLQYTWMIRCLQVLGVPEIVLAD